MNRENVYKLLDGERDFQNGSGRSIEEKPHDPMTWASIMEEYVAEAFDAACNGHQDEAMGFLRKATAVGVAAMEQHGAPPREEGGTYPHEPAPNSEKFVHKARTRLLKLVGKENLGTDDPLMTEIALSQVDATLAVARAIAEVRDELRAGRREAQSGFPPHYRPEWIPIRSNLGPPPPRPPRREPAATRAERPWWKFWN